MQTAEFVLTPSKKLPYFLYGLHITASIVILSLHVSWVGKIIAVLFLVFSCFREIKNNILKPERPRKKDYKDYIVRVWHETERKFGVESLTGKMAMGTLKGDSFKCSWFIILRIKLSRPHNSRTVTLFIPKDALPPLEYNALCTRLLSY